MKSRLHEQSLPTQANMYQGFRQSATADFVLVAAVSTAKRNVLSANQGVKVSVVHVSVSYAFRGVFMMAVYTDISQAQLSLNWWLEVGATHPLCIYYFGPFDTQVEAESAQNVCVGDLKHQNSQIVYASVKFCQPRQLVIHENELTIHDLKVSPPTFFEALVMR